MAATSVEDPSEENPLVAGLERLPVHPTALVIFGGSGDLAHRKILPALYNLAHEGALPERFELIGVARRKQSDEDFQAAARESIERFSRRRPDPDVLEGLLNDMRYVSGAFDQDSVYGELERALREFDQHAGYALDRVFYLSTAPQFFPVIAGKLGEAGLNRTEEAETRIVIEKPFGYDLASARALNAEVLEVFDESQVFRIDHYLGKENGPELDGAAVCQRAVRAGVESQLRRSRADHRGRGHRHRRPGRVLRGRRRAARSRPESHAPAAGAADDGAADVIRREPAARREAKGAGGDRPPGAQRT